MKTGNRKATNSLGAVCPTLRLNIYLPLGVFCLLIVTAMFLVVMGGQAQAEESIQNLNVTETAAPRSATTNTALNNPENPLYWMDCGKYDNGNTSTDSNHKNRAVVWCGQYGERDIVWRVLDSDGSGVGGVGGITMLSEYVLEQGLPYGTLDDTSLRYETTEIPAESTENLRSWMNSFGTQFTERSRLMPTSVANASWDLQTETAGTTSDAITNAIAFPLSAAETSTYFYDGTGGKANWGPEDENRVAFGEGSGVAFWWTRTPYGNFDLGSYKSYCGGMVNGTGKIAEYVTTNKFDWTGVRPAVNLNPSNILFTSAAPATGGTPAVNPVLIDTSIPAQTKLTDIKGASYAQKTYRLFKRGGAAGTVQIQKNSIFLNTVKLVWSGAATSNSYVNCLLVDTTTHQKWQTRAAATTTASGSVIVTLPGEYVGDSKYRMFAWIENEGTQSTSSSIDTALLNNLPGAPIVTSEPADVYVTDKGKAEFTVAASGNATLSYQWQSSTDSGITWTNISGATGTTYSLTAARSQNGYKYRCVIKNGYGSVESKTALLTVYESPSAAVADPSYWLDCGAYDNTGISDVSTGNHKYRAVVWYGQYGGNDIPWRVLDSDGSGVGGVKGLTMLSEYMLQGSVKFGLNNITSRSYSTSTEGIRDWMTAFAADFTGKDKMIPTSVGNSGWLPETNSVIDDSISQEKAFPLSGAEVMSYFYDGTGKADNIDTGDLNRYAWDNNGVRTVWWLRTPTGPYKIGLGNAARVVTWSGVVGLYVTSNTFDYAGPRPAFNFDASTSVFTSASCLGGAPAVSTTLTDTSISAQTKLSDLKTEAYNQKVFRVFTKGGAAGTARIAKNGTSANTVKLVWSGAATSNSYVNCLLVDTTTRQKWQTRAAATTSATGSVNVTLPGNYVGDSRYRMYAWVENESTKKTGSAIDTVLLNNIPAAPAITTQPSAVTKVEGEKATFTVAASGTATLTYQWQSSTDGKTWSNITGASAASYTFTTAYSQNKAQYRCIVTNNWGSATSNGVALTVYQKPTASITPASANIYNGKTQKFTATATGTGPYKYEWYEGTTLKKTNENISSTTNEYTTSALTTTTKVKCVITGKAGATYAATSKEVTVTVYPLPAISKQPANCQVYTNKTISMSVTATGQTLSYQWYKGNKGTTTNPVANATGASLSIANAVTANGGTYWCRVTDGGGNYVDSNAATASVYALPVVTTNPSAWSNYEGETIQLSVSSTGTGLGFTWYKGTVGNPSASTMITAGGTDQITTITNADISGGKKSTLAITKATQDLEGTYWCRVTDGGNNTVDSKGATVSVWALPTLTNAGQQNTDGTAGSGWSQAKTLYVTTNVDDSKTIQSVYYNTDNQAGTVTGVLTYNSASKRYETASGAITANGTYYLFVKDSGNRTASVSVKVEKVDRTAPTGTIKVGEKTILAGALDVITFGNYFKERQSFTVSGEDKGDQNTTGSGVDTIRYHLSQTTKTSQQLQQLAEDNDASKGWKSYGAFSIAAAPNASWVIYVKITDHAGNKTYLASEGLVFDDTPPDLYVDQYQSSAAGRNTGNLDKGWRDGNCKRGG